MYHMKWVIGKVGSKYIAVCICAFTLILVGNQNLTNPSNQLEEGESSLDETKSDINIFIIICTAQGTDRLEKERARQMQQVNTLLKTIFLFTDTLVNVYILNNDENVFNNTLKDIEAWNVKTDHILRLESVNITYPHDLTGMVNMFKMCATARLFIDIMLPNVDAGIFIDTDSLVMDNIKNLWNYFHKFNSAQVMGEAATENIYDKRIAVLPYFGPPGVGLNAGVMLMNLTRMREMSGGGFTGSVRWVFGRHKKEITLADQDIINTLFGYSPWYLYELPCTWNYILWQCGVGWSRTENTRSWLGVNQCPKAKRLGVSLLHGLSGSFYNDFDEIFQQTYDYWVNFSPSSDKLSASAPHLQNMIQQAQDKTGGQTGWDIQSPCARVPDIKQVITGRLAQVLEEMGL